MNLLAFNTVCDHFTPHPFHSTQLHNTSILIIMSFMKYATVCLAAAHQVAAQLVDDTWKGPGNLYLIQGDYYNRPSDPFPLEYGCVNADGKLIADNGNCAVFEANVTHLISDAGECGWDSRDSDGGEPYTMTCATPTPRYYGIYRLVSQTSSAGATWRGGFLSVVRGQFDETNIFSTSEQ